MNAFKRTSTTAYSSQNLSILTLESISAPETYEPNVTAFRKGLDAVLTGDSNITSAYLTAAGWFLRLYQDEFKNDTGSPISLLIVQQQFTVMPGNMPTQVKLQTTRIRRHMRYPPICRRQLPRRSINTVPLRNTLLPSTRLWSLDSRSSFARPRSFVLSFDPGSAYPIRPNFPKST